MTDRQPHNLVFYKLENSPGWLPADLFGDIDSAKRICEKYKKMLEVGNCDLIRVLRPLSWSRRAFYIISLERVIIMADLDILNTQMSVGQVKTIHTGTHLDYVEMLFSDDLSAQLAPLDDGTIQFNVKDSEFRLPNMSCKMDKETLHSLILYLKELYSQNLGK